MPAMLSVKLSCEPSHCSKQLLARKRVGDVAIGTLLLTPIFIAGGVLRGHQNHWDSIELRVAFEFASHLKAVALRHDHVEQNHGGSLGSNGFLDQLGVV